MASTEISTKNQDQLLQVLANEEIMNSIVMALEKLPTFLEQYSTIEKTLESFRENAKFSGTVMDLVSEFGSQIPEITIGTETIDAVATIINKLPKIAEYLNVMDQLCDITQTVISDKKMMGFVMNGVKSLAEPVQNKIQDGLSIVEEVRERAKADHTTMSIFSVIGLLKDPKVQEGLRYVKAFLTVLGERQEQQH